MEPGVYEIQGKDIYAQVFDAETGSVEELFVLSVLIEGIWTLLSNHVLIAPGT